MTKKENAAHMAKLVKDFKHSGKSQKDFALSHGIKEGKLHYWISKLTKAGKTTSTNDSPTPIVPKNFVPITVGDTTDRNAQHLLIRLQSGVEIEIPL